ncbi:MAG: exodeoxyribonuclease VII large subunit [Lentisphaeria bacterium]|jgi:exodeoxyribonuclease VII large subunit
MRIVVKLKPLCPALIHALSLPANPNVMLPEPTKTPHSNQTVYSVSQLNRKVKDLLESHFPLLWVEGEISNLSRPSSGHWYFTLKDEGAQVSCAMFKGRNSRVNFVPVAGDRVKVRARVSLYEGRGDYQIIAEHMEQAGFGLLQKRFDELKQKLLNEGLFDEAFKKPLPAQPAHIAVITSPTGAAIRDVLSVLKRRMPNIPVTIIPSPVQGEDAPAKLIEALSLANHNKKFDVILLCRGGGSIEDLWAFNSEKLAKAIFASDTPVVCAVGHEVDFTIADFVADLRAPTPSAAAEILSPDRLQVLAKCTHLKKLMQLRMLAKIERLNEKLHYLSKHIRHPKDRIQQWSQKLDKLEMSLERAMKQHLAERNNQLATLKQRILRCTPKTEITHHSQALEQLRQRLKRSIQSKLAMKSNQLQHTMDALDLVSPISTMKRGYSITTNTQNKLVTRLTDVAVGESIITQVADGEIVSLIETKVPAP